MHFNCVFLHMRSECYTWDRYRILHSISFFSLYFCCFWFDPMLLYSIPFQFSSMQSSPVHSIVFHVRPWDYSSFLSLFSSLLLSFHCLHESSCLGHDHHFASLNMISRHSPPRPIQIHVCFAWHSLIITCFFLFILLVLVRVAFCVLVFTFFPYPTLRWPTKFKQNRTNLIELSHPSSNSVIAKHINSNRLHFKTDSINIWG